MKRCPFCRTTYTDDSLRYCLADGAELISGRHEEETVVKRRNEPVRVTIPSNELHGPSPERRQPPRSSIGKIVAIVAAASIILFVVVIAIGALIYFSAKSGDAAVNKTIIANTTPTPDVEKQRLQDEMANVQRKLDEQQKNANRPANVQTFPSPNRPGVVTARVHSPKDGFLALRNQPDADYGERIAKIPHGSMITIENCDRSAVSIGGRSGRWCLVSWNGYEGYVFDAWLVY